MRRYFEALLLLLLAAGFATLASTGRLGWPLVLLGSLAWLLRAALFVQRRPVRCPPRWLALGLTLYLPLYLADGLYFSAGFLDASLHAVVVIGAAKLFSMQSGRDDLTLGMLAFLEVMTAALLTVSGIFFILFLVFLVLLIATLVAHEMAQAQAAAHVPVELAPRPAPGPRVPLLRFSLWLSFGVAVVTVLTFFLLPRTTLGAWNAQRPATGLSGFSDDVRLGAIANLQRTDNPVMHIRLASADPPIAPAAFEQIPWRGRGLSSFDGKRWFSPDAPTLHGTQSGRLEVNSLSLREPPRIVRYQVTLEPIASPVLFFPARLLRAATHFHLLAWDRATMTLASPGGDDGAYANFAGTSYSGVSNLARPTGQELRASPAPNALRLRFELRPFLQLPDDLDPRIRALARSIVAHTPADNWDRMQALTLYLQTHYQYSLDDLPQGGDPLASFLFDQPAGDCEYFASALAVMARSLDIPTRLVNGFLVGSYNPLSGEYLVRGRDAHSWVEAYFPQSDPNAYYEQRYRLPGRGVWMTFDATPPGALDGSGTNMLFDALSSFWQERIVNYDWLQQAGIARRLQSGLGNTAGEVWQSSQAAVQNLGQNLFSPRGADWAGAGFLLALLGLALAQTARRRPGLWRRWLRSSRPRGLSPGERARRDAGRAYRRFQRYLARAGHPRAPAQTAQELLAALAGARPGSALAAAAAGFIGAYEAQRFGPDPARPGLASALARQLLQVRRLCARPRAI